MRRCRRKGQWMSKHSSRSSAGGEPTCDAGDPGPIPGSGRYLGEGKGSPLQCSWASLVAQMVKNLPATRETQVRSLGWEDPLEKGKAAHSSVLAWRIPWTEEPGGLRFTGSRRGRQDRATEHGAQHRNHTRGNIHREGSEGHFSGGPMAEDSACQCGEHRLNPWSGSQGPTRRETAESPYHDYEASAPSSHALLTRGNGAASTTAQPKIRKELRDSFWFPDTWVVGVSEGEVMRETEKVFEEIMAPNFPNWMKTISPQIPEAK